MWHEARKQEKKIRSLMVDYRKRADRRRDFYQKIKLDPAQFLRIYGRPAKIHWEQSVAVAAESPQSMMPWQGDSSIMIDRFDVRAHLDYIPNTWNTEEPELTQSDEEEERNANYERYRILVQNECAGVAEEQCLQQIYVDEMYGGQEVKVKEKEKQEEKAKLAEKKVAISFKYDDEPEKEEKKEEVSDPESEESIDSDMDLDAVFDVDKITTEQTLALNQLSVIYGMVGDDYISCLWKDKDEAEELRIAKLMEEEKAQFSGRKSRRERRAYKEKRLRERGSLSPPSYAKRDSPKYEPYKKPPGRSKSRSVSPVVRTKKKFITSFGGSDDEPVMQGPSLPPHLLNKSEKPASRKSKSPPMFKEIGPSVAKFKAVSTKHKGSSSSRSPSPKSSKTHSRRRSRSRSRSPYMRSGGRRSRWGSRRSRSRSRSRTYSRRSRSPRSRAGRYGRSSSRSRSSRSHRSRSRSRRSRSRGSRPRRSRSYRSRSYQSRSSSSSSSGRSRSKSKTPEKVVEVPTVFRRRSITPSSSELSASEEESTGDTTTQAKTAAQQDMGKLDAVTNKQSRLSIQDRMKKKMQKVLNQQSKADKRARQEKKEKEDMERLEREEELRLIAIDLRRKEREKRHQEQLEMERMEVEERKREEYRRKEREAERVEKSNGSKTRRSRSPSRSAAQSKKADSKSSEGRRSKSPNRRSQGADSRSSYSKGSYRKRSRSKERRSRSSERGYRKSSNRSSDSRSSGKVPKLVDY